jgi:hypothetical protein
MEHVAAKRTRALQSLHSTNFVLRSWRTRLRHARPRNQACGRHSEVNKAGSVSAWQQELQLYLYCGRTAMLVNVLRLASHEPGGESVLALGISERVGVLFYCSAQQRNGS